MISLLFQVVAAEQWWQASDYPFLNSQSFRAIQAQPFLKVVKFFTPWCKYCKVIKPWFQTVAAQMQNDNIKFYNMNCDGSGSQICIQMRVYSYPSIMVVHKRQVIWRYEGLIGEDRLLSSLTQLYQQKFPKASEKEEDKREEKKEPELEVKADGEVKKEEEKAESGMQTLMEQIRRNKQTLEQKYSNLNSAVSAGMSDQKAQTSQFNLDLQTLKNQLAKLTSTVEALAHNHSLTDQQVQTLRTYNQQRSLTPQSAQNNLELQKEESAWRDWLQPISLCFSVGSFLMVVYLLSRETSKSGRV